VHEWAAYNNMYASFKFLLFLTPRKFKRRIHQRYAQCRNVMRQGRKNCRKLVCLISLALINLTLTSFVDEPICGKLEDGRYKVKFRKFEYDAFEYVLVIDKDNFVEYRDGKETRGKIMENKIVLFA